MESSTPSETSLTIECKAHPLLDARAFWTRFPKCLAEFGVVESVVSKLSDQAESDVDRPEDVKSVVRDLFRNGGYKPTGRGKPASEYLVRAVAEQKLAPINVAVDVCNVVSFHSGLPISVVDLELVQPPLSIGLAPADSQYVFNASGQTIKLDGLICLFDSVGPCANGVKDSQRTKTSPKSKNTLTVIWGTNQLPGHSYATENWYRTILHSIGCQTESTLINFA